MSNKKEEQPVFVKVEELKKFFDPELYICKPTNEIFKKLQATKLEKNGLCRELGNEIIIRVRKV